MNLIQRLKQALQDNLNCRNGQGLPAHMAEDALFGKALDLKYRKDELRAFLQQIYEDQGDQAYLGALARAGISMKMISVNRAVDQLPAVSNQRTGDYWRAAALFGLHPDLPWDVGMDGEPYSELIEVDEERKRWLLWNPESGEYFISVSLEEVTAIMASDAAAYASDVTGIPAHEEEWSKRKTENGGI